MIKIGDRARMQPPPPRFVFEALSNPDANPARPWLTLLSDEQRPVVIESDPPISLAWSSIWSQRPDAIIRFELSGDRNGTNLRWMLYVDEPPPDQPLIGHMRKRMNQLINANLRYTFGQ